MIEVANIPEWRVLSLFGRVPPSLTRPSSQEARISNEGERIRTNHGRCCVLRAYEYPLPPLPTPARPRERITERSVERPPPPGRRRPTRLGLLAECAPALWPPIAPFPFAEASPARALDQPAPEANERALASRRRAAPLIQREDAVHVRTLGAPRRVACIHLPLEIKGAVCQWRGKC